MLEALESRYKEAPAGPISRMMGQLDNLNTAVTFELGKCLQNSVWFLGMLSNQRKELRTGGRILT